MKQGDRSDVPSEVEEAEHAEDEEVKEDKMIGASRRSSSQQHHRRHHTSLTPWQELSYLTPLSSRMFYLQSTSSIHISNHCRTT